MQELQGPGESSLSTTIPALTTSRSEPLRQLTAWASPVEQTSPVIYQPMVYERYQPIEQIQTRPRHSWPAVLLLCLLAPMVAEMLTGSTPPLAFINPLSLLLQVGLYGTGATLARELVRRRGLGWGRLLLLGAAYGILEEGLTIGSWYNPYWPDIKPLGNYGWLFGTNWIWAFGLTTFHAVFSITIPVILVETIFPNLASRPWLGRRSYRWMITWLTITSILTLLLLGVVFAAVASKGVYTHPPLMWFGALGLALLFLRLGLRRSKSAVTLQTPSTIAAPSSVSYKRPPRLWTLRIFAFFGPIVYFVLTARTPLPAAIELLLDGLVVFLVAWRIRTWARRPGWGARQRLALASGAMACFLALAPILELQLPKLGKNGTGMTVAAVGWLALLIWLAWRARHTEKQSIKNRVSL